MTRVENQNINLVMLILHTNPQAARSGLGCGLVDIGQKKKTKQVFSTIRSPEHRMYTKFN